MGDSVLAVIPARGGSKGIPRKNARPLAGKPLVVHAIELARSSVMVDRTVLTTDDDEIARIGDHFGVDEVVNRPDDLAADEVPLAPVITHAFEQHGGDADYVLCLQPTAPVLSLASLEAGIERGVANRADSVVYVTDATEHYWRERDGAMELLSDARANRQQMDPIYEEIGVFLTRADVVRTDRRIGDDPTFQVVPDREGVDVDTYGDWLLAENYLNRKLICYRVTGNRETGIGHITRGITIAKHCFEHDVQFAATPADDLAIDLLERGNFAYETYDDDDGFEDLVEELGANIVVNDVLNTQAEPIRRLKARGLRVVNVEDLGPGAAVADATINALYEHSRPGDNQYFGTEYICLRDEFRYVEPKTGVESVDRIMVSFGGVDENDLTRRSAEAVRTVVEDSGIDSLTLDVVLGLGYERQADLEALLDSFPTSIETEVHQDVDHIAAHMRAADLLITSNGRTVYEAASLNLPMISISQNERESRHLFSHISQGVNNLGMAATIEDGALSTAIREYIDDADLRASMVAALAEEDLRGGVDRVLAIIVDGGGCSNADR